MIEHTLRQAKLRSALEFDSVFCGSEIAPRKTNRVGMVQLDQLVPILPLGVRDKTAAVECYIACLETDRQRILTGLLPTALEFNPFQQAPRFPSLPFSGMHVDTIMSFADTDPIAHRNAA